MARSVMSRLSPPRSLMSSAERPVPMPRTSASRLTSTSTSITTSSKSTTTNSTSTPTSTTTSTSPRSSLTSPSLVFSSQSRSSPKGRSGTEEERSKRIESEATSLPTIHACLLYNFFANLGGCAIFLLDGTTHWGTQCHEIIEKSLVHYTWFECTSLR